MALSKEEAQAQINSFFGEKYQIIYGQQIPTLADLAFGNIGKEIDLAVLFIDLRESTRIVRALSRDTSAKMYKSFLWGIAKIARQNQGETKSFNGDGVLIIFHGDNKESHAVSAAMQMSYFVQQILKPKIQSYIDKSIKLQDMDFSFGIGIDTGTVLVVRGGIKGENNNELVWVGNATNQAVKLSAMSKTRIDNKLYHIFITKNIYDALPESQKFHKEPKAMFRTPMWRKRLAGLLVPLTSGGAVYYTSFYKPLS